jgi:hypothetical protein
MKFIKKIKFKTMKKEKLLIKFGISHIKISEVKIVSSLIKRN